MGIDPARYGRVDKTALRDGVTREQALRDVAAGGIIIGPAYASAAHLGRGDSVVLVGPDGRRRVRVAAVQDAVGPYGGRLFQMSLATMQSVYGIDSDAQLKVKARSDAARPALERRIGTLVATRYPNLELQSLADRKAEIDREIAQPFNMFNAIVAIAVIVSLLGVVNTLAMSVIERTREIGVLRALGASRWTVRRTMLDESLLITVTGALFGVIVGTLIALVWMRGLSEMLPGIVFHFPAVTIAAVAVAAVAFGVIASLLPARRAARLKPIEALTYE
jgi:putative ABC transport system permease protein